METRGSDFEAKHPRNEDGTFAPKDKNSGLTGDAESSIIGSRGDRMTISSSIESPIEQKHSGKGNPNAILHYGAELNNRQRKLLDKLPEYDSRVIVNRDDVNMSDLAVLTAYTGDEFAMFTKGSDRLVIRGNERKCEIDYEDALELAKQGYRWSGHTHNGDTFLSMQPSDGDYSVLKAFNQEFSVIYNSKGDFRTFENRR